MRISDWSSDVCSSDLSGIDPIGISRALWSNVTSSGTQGGSTLTQQLVKNEYLSSERTLWRKAREAVLSVKLERTADKDEILERYLNTVYFGRGSYGIRSEEHTSELQSLMRISYAVFCLKKKNNIHRKSTYTKQT